jgi:PKD repeat protein
MVTIGAPGVIVDFAYSPNSLDPLYIARPGTTITFTDLSLNLDVNAPCKFEWDWGDGSTWGTTQNATHIYSRPGNFTVVHWVTGGVNKGRNEKTITIPVGADLSPKPLCNPLKGDPTGISRAGDRDVWLGTYPNMWCRNPYTCTCEPRFAKYKCNPNGNEVLIWEFHADCCAFCLARGEGTSVIPPGTEEPVISMPVFQIESIDVTPPNPGRTELVTVIAHIKNVGNAAGAATVVFYWDDGTPLDQARTTEWMGVNTTQATAPAKGFPPGTGIQKICAVLQ